MVNFYKIHNVCKIQKYQNTSDILICTIDYNLCDKALRNDVLVKSLLDRSTLLCNVCTSICNL